MLNFISPGGSQKYYSLYDFGDVQFRSKLFSAQVYLNHGIHRVSYTLLFSKVMNSFGRKVLEPLYRKMYAQNFQKLHHLRHLSLRTSFIMTHCYRPSTLLKFEALFRLLHKFSSSGNEISFHSFLLLMLLIFH
jgi:hypothetical protein